MPADLKDQTRHKTRIRILPDGSSGLRVRSHAFLCTKLYQLIYISLCFLVFLWIYNSSFGDIQSLAAFLSASSLPMMIRFARSSFRICAAASYVLLSSDSGSTIVFLSAFALVLNFILAKGQKAYYNENIE